MDNILLRKGWTEFVLFFFGGKMMITMGFVFTILFFYLITSDVCFFLGHSVTTYDLIMASNVSPCVGVCLLTFTCLAYPMTEVIVTSYVYVLSTILPLIQALVLFNSLLRFAHLSLYCYGTSPVPGVFSDRVPRLEVLGCGFFILYTTYPWIRLGVSY